MANEPKRAKAHHVLPQFYLRAWSDDQGRVAMLNRDGREVMTGTRALAVETDFYAITGPDGKKDSSVEEAIAAWDGKGAAVHAAFLRGDFPPTDDQRIEFGLWLGLQWLRGRSSRQTGAEVVDKLQKMLIQFGLENAASGEPPSPQEAVKSQQIIDELGPGTPVPDLSRLPEEAKDLLRDTDRYTFEPSREEQILHMVRAVPDAAEPFLDSEWHLLRFDKPVLLTSDEPIILSRKPTPENQFLGLGPLNADELLIPLSPTHCLGMVRVGQVGQESISDLPLSAATELNHGSVHNWWRQLFRHPAGPAFPDDPPPLPEEQVVIG